MRNEIPLCPLYQKGAKGDCGVTLNIRLTPSNIQGPIRITRNKRDYVTDILPILTPEEFLAAIAV
jgi:hypothetical protein